MSVVLTVLGDTGDSHWYTFLISRGRLPCGGSGLQTTLGAAGLYSAWGFNTIHNLIRYVGITYFTQFIKSSC